MTDAQDDGMSKKLFGIVQARKELGERHAALRASPEFKEALGCTRKLIDDFRTGIASIGFMSTRWPGFHKQLLSLRIHDHHLQSAIAILALIESGLLAPARREMRFVVEASIKAWASDASAPGSEVADKVEELDDLGNTGFRKIVCSIKSRLISGNALNEFPSRSTALYKQLCTHVHLSSGQMKNDFARFDRAEYFGFESVGELREINATLEQVFDLALLAQFEVFDSGLVGDIFVHTLDEQADWLFHKTFFVESVPPF